MESPESILEVAGNAQEEPGLSLGSSGHRVGYWVTGLRVFVDRPEKHLSPPEIGFWFAETGTAENRTGLHHRRIGLQVSLPGLAGSSSWVPSINDPTPTIEGSASRPPETASPVLSLSGYLSLWVSRSLCLSRHLSLSRSRLSDLSISLSRLCFSPLALPLCSRVEKEGEEGTKNREERKKKRKKRRKKNNLPCKFFSFLFFFN
jgi:hypothetical protein